MTEHRLIRAAAGSREIIGSKKYMVFYEGQFPKGKKTSWVMREYCSFKVPPSQRTYVLYKLKNNSSEKTFESSCNEVQSSLPPYDSERPATGGAGEQVNQLGKTPASFPAHDIRPDEVNAPAPEVYGLEHLKAATLQLQFDIPEMLNGQCFVGTPTVVAPDESPHKWTTLSSEETDLSFQNINHNDEFPWKQTDLSCEETTPTHISGHLQKPFSGLFAENINNTNEESVYAEPVLSLDLSKTDDKSENLSEKNLKVDEVTGSKTCSNPLCSQSGVNKQKEEEPCSVKETNKISRGPLGKTIRMNNICRCAISSVNSVRQVPVR